MSIPGVYEQCSPPRLLNIILASQPNGSTSPGRMIASSSTCSRRSSLFPPESLIILDRRILDDAFCPMLLFGPWLTIHSTSPSKSPVCCFFFSHHLLRVLQQRSVEDAQFNPQFLRDTLLQNLPQCECEAQMALFAKYPLHPPFLASLPPSLQQLD